MEFSKPAKVLVRDVAASFPDCIRQGTAPIDLSEARRQHADYKAKLRSLGLVVEVLPVPEEQPDAVFVEDTAVVLSTKVVLTRPGAEARRAEVQSVRGALLKELDVIEMEPPCTLDGGDVLRVGETLFIGSSERTNREGVIALIEVALEDGLDCVVVPVRGGLHLKSVVTMVDPARVIVEKDSIDTSAFEEKGLTCLETKEAFGANVLALGDDVLVSASAPKTAQMLSELHRVHVVDVGQFHLGDGALTCLSIRIPPAGAWVT